MIRISAVILAAGESTRMGRPKALVAWGGVPLLRYHLDQLAAIDEIAEIIVVSGHAAEEVEALAAGAPSARAVRNDAYRSGKVSSILAGVAAIDAGADALLLMAVDQPRPAALVRALIAAYAASRAAIVLPAHEGRRGHPLVFDRALFGELREIREETLGVRALLDAHAGEARVVEWADASVLLDVNTPADLEA
ncbi:MAG: nucleotidyltransferase family protein [Dehalococcoidia bacterium]